MISVISNEKAEHERRADIPSSFLCSAAMVKDETVKAATDYVNERNIIEEKGCEIALGSSLPSALSKSPASFRQALQLLFILFQDTYRPEMSA
jgi:hypothetical protein